MPAELNRTLNPAATGTSPTARLMSVDALRGFDMFWIIGADSLVYALNQMSQTAPTRLLATQLDHAEWQGFHFYDLIFPLFVFIMGVSLVFSLSKTMAQAGRAEALKRVFRRGILLFVVGIFYYGAFTHEWPNIRLLGVLNRIALAYFFGGLLFCFFKPRVLAGICAALLLGYWALMAWVPIRDIQLTRENLAILAAKAGDDTTAAFYQAKPAKNPSTIKQCREWATAEKLFYATTNRVSGRFEPGLNVANHFDFQYLPGKKWDDFYDPEGVLSTIPAVGTCLLGVFAGLLLQSAAFSPKRKVALLVGCGIAAAALGWLWGLHFPVVKKIWTSSYVLVAGGYSATLLGLFYLLVDVWQWRQWCQPFVWMGMNSITIYLASQILGGFENVALRFVGGDIKAFFDTRIASGSGDLLAAFVGLVLAFWFVRFLYLRKVFLRL